MLHSFNVTIVTVKFLEVILLLLLLLHESLSTKDDDAHVLMNLLLQISKLSETPNPSRVMQLAPHADAPFIHHCNGCNLEVLPSTAAGQISLQKMMDDDAHVLLPFFPAEIYRL